MQRMLSCTRRAVTHLPPRQCVRRLHDLQLHYDFKSLAERAPAVQKNIELRKSKGDAFHALKLHEEYIALLHRAEELRTERNALAKSKTATPQQRQETGRRLKEELAAIDAQLGPAKAVRDAAAAALPCDSHPAAPVGSEEAARTVLTVGERPAFDFTPRDHVALGKHLQLFDFSAASDIAGSGFVVYRNAGVQLEQALINWALSRASAAGFSLVAPPDLAAVGLVEGCGFNPRGHGNATPTAPAAAAPAAASAAAAGGGGSAAASPTIAPPAAAAVAAAAAASGLSQVYSVANSDLCLIGTSEISLAGLHADSIFDAADVPATYAAVSHCFRREAGSSGARDRGLYRLHQFTKVELFAYIAPTYADTPAHIGGAIGGGGEAASGRHHHHHHAPAATTEPLLPNPASDAILRRLVDLQIMMYSELGLHFRVLDMPTEELGASAYRKYDIEAWMPCRPTATAAAAAAAGPASGGAGAAASAPLGDFGEICSASNCVDYQARRLNIRYKHAQNDNRFVHTLNATACAIPRVMLALLETHQRADGSVAIPPALQPFLGGLDALRPPPPLQAGGAGREGALFAGVPARLPME